MFKYVFGFFFQVSLRNWRRDSVVNAMYSVRSSNRDIEIIFLGTPGRYSFCEYLSYNGTRQIPSADWLVVLYLNQHYFMIMASRWFQVTIQLHLKMNKN